MKLVICGFSGAGKTWALAKLAQHNTLPELLLFDLDHELAQSLGLKNHQLGNWIRDHGIAAFREAEKAKLTELTENEKFIISLGAGALDQNLVNFCDQNSILGFWINEDFETCWQRIKDDPNRPLVDLGKDAVHKKYLERSDLYKLFPSFSSSQECYSQIVKKLANF